MSDGTRLQLDELVHLRASAHALEAGSRRLALAVQAGSYRSAWRGRGLEFDEVRLYQSGDDVRTIDWRVTARRGRPHTKLFREERERPLMLMADLHPGMYFGSRVQFKTVLAGRLAALLGWAAVRAGDRVGGLVSGPAGHHEIPPTARSHGLLPLLEQMTRLQPRSPGPPEAGRMDLALGRLARLVRPGSLVVVISDFRELGEAGERHLGALGRHNDVILVFTHDPLEANPPPPGRYPLGSDGLRLLLDTSRGDIVEAWSGQFQQHRQHLQQLCRRHGLHLLPAATSEPPLRTLQRGLARHAGRLP